MSNKASQFVSVSVFNLFGFVMGIMFSLCQDNKVFQPIVGAVSIDVMDVFIPQEQPSNLSFHQKTMFCLPLHPSPDFYVSLAVPNGTNAPVMMTTLPHNGILSFGLSLGGAAYRAESLFTQVWLEYGMAEYAQFGVQFSHGNIHPFYCSLSKMFDCVNRV